MSSLPAGDTRRSGAQRRERGMVVEPIAGREPRDRFPGGRLPPSLSRSTPRDKRISFREKRI